MAQVTLYLDDETARRAKAAAEAAGLSQSRWLSELIREKTTREWPAVVREAAGAWPDFPDTRKLRRGTGRDSEREPL